MTAMSQINNLPANELKQLIQRGIIKAVITKPIPTTIETTPEYKKFKNLQGVEIHVAEAGRKYDIAFQTISRWKQKGFIKVLRKEGQKIYLDESYVAYCTYVYRQSSGPGKWAFNEDGTPRPFGIDLRKKE
jgi:hypothetical protein